MSGSDRPLPLTDDALSVAGHLCRVPLLHLTPSPLLFTAANAATLLGALNAADQWDETVTAPPTVHGEILTLHVTPGPPIRPFPVNGEPLDEHPEEEPQEARVVTATLTAPLGDTQVTVTDLTALTRARQIVQAVIGEQPYWPAGEAVWGHDAQLRESAYVQAFDVPLYAPVRRARVTVHVTLAARRADGAARVTLARPSGPATLASIPRAALPDWSADEPLAASAVAGVTDQLLRLLISTQALP